MLGGVCACVFVLLIVCLNARLFDWLCGSAYACCVFVYLANCLRMCVCVFVCMRVRVCVCEVGLAVVHLCYCVRAWLCVGAFVCGDVCGVA